MDEWVVQLPQSLQIGDCDQLQGGTEAGWDLTRGFLPVRGERICPAGFDIPYCTVQIWNAQHSCIAGGILCQVLQ